MDDSQARQKRAVAAASEVANGLGVPVLGTRVLKDSNNTIVLLEPAGLVAKVGTTILRPDAQQTLGREVAIGRYLAARGASVAPPAGDVAPGPHLKDGMAITLWRYIEPSIDPDVADEDLGRMLRSFHDTFIDYPEQLPDFTDNLTRAQSALEDVDRTPRLPESDRVFLLEVAASLRSELTARDLPRLPLHGDPHLDGNVVLSNSGPLLVDFEATCVGPYEWDLTSLDPARAAYPDADPELLARLSRMRSLTVSTSCWMQYGRAPEVDEAAHVHLKLLRGNASG